MLRIFLNNKINIFFKNKFPQIQAFSEKETALLIDRYKFLGLLPCADNELGAIGYWVRCSSFFCFYCCCYPSSSSSSFSSFSSFSSSLGISLYLQLCFLLCSHAISALHTAVVNTHSFFMSLSFSFSCIIN